MCLWSPTELQSSTDNNLNFTWLGKHIRMRRCVVFVTQVHWYCIKYFGFDLFLLYVYIKWKLCVPVGWDCIIYNRTDLPTEISNLLSRICGVLVTYCYVHAVAFYVTSRVTPCGVFSLSFYNGTCKLWGMKGSFLEA